MLMQTHIEDVQRVTYPGNRPSKIRSQTGKTEKKYYLQVNQYQM